MRMNVLGYHFQEIENENYPAEPLPNSSFFIFQFFDVAKVVIIHKPL